MNNYVKTIEDNGGVHINSGIPNRAFYLTAVELGGFAWEKAGQIWYKTLTEKLSERSSFQQAADLTFETAGELYGVGKSWSKMPSKKVGPKLASTSAVTAPSGLPLTVVLRAFGLAK